ncbi:MAG: hypothetical protein HY748_13015 [Elusimicrobia bacterium]|nr:hypothetical protein [Elusimicrobiota bacterium]
MRLLETLGLPWSAAKALLSRGLRRLMSRRFPRNSALRAAFEAYSRDRSPGTRRAFYDALLKSRLIVGTRRPPGKRALDVAQLAVGSQAGLIAVADPAQLESTVPEWSESAAVEGKLLFRMAVQQGRDFVIADLFGERLAFKGADLKRLAAGEMPQADPAPAKLAAAGRTRWSRPDPAPSASAPSGRALSILREEASAAGLAGCYLLKADLGEGAERTALVFEVRGEAGLAAVRRYMERVDLRLRPEDWGGPVHIVAMTRREIEPLRPLALVISERPRS